MSVGLRRLSTSFLSDLVHSPVADETPTMRNMILVPGDQLDHAAAAFDGFDSERDVIWMAEAEEDTTHVWWHKLRIALFLSRRANEA